RPAASPEHGGNLVPHRREHAPHVDIEDLAIVRLGGLGERPGPLDPGVVERNVQPAVLRERLLDEGLDVRLLAHVGPAEVGVASARRKWASPWSFRFSSPAASPSFSRRPERTTFAPAFANAIAAAFPIPLVPPVTRTTFPVNCDMVSPFPD